MILPVLKYPDPVLGKKCEDVKEFTPELKELVMNMLETMYANDGIGLAAPQVGESIRLVVVDISGPDERTDPMVLINPEITKTGEDVDSDEGCLSVEDYTAKVVRSDKIKVKAQDLDGQEISFDADGLKAICLQHECDHLDGVLFIDRISRLKRNMYDKKIAKAQREEERDKS